MMTEPTIVTKDAQPYAAMVLTVSQPEIATKAPQLIDEVIGWMKGRGVEPNGAPFFNYRTFLPDGRMEMEVGMPAKTLVQGDAKVTTGTLPGGRYASLTHTGPYHELHDANMRLDTWAREQGLALDGNVEGQMFKGATRLEIYHKDGDASAGSDPVTEVAFRLVD